MTDLSFREKKKTKLVSKFPLLKCVDTKYLWNRLAKFLDYLSI